MASSSPTPKKSSLLGDESAAPTIAASNSSMSGFEKDPEAAVASDAPRDDHATKKTEAGNNTTLESSPSRTKSDEKARDDDASLGVESSKEGHVEEGDGEVKEEKASSSGPSGSEEKKKDDDDDDAEEKNKDAGKLEKTATAVSKAAGASLRPAATREDGKEYPKGIKLAVITIALCLSVFLMALDNAIITTAIPRITDQFNSLADVGWYGSAYLLTTAALQLTFGKFYTYFSIKWIYLTAIFLFELGSLICGVANSSLTLIMGRAIAGLGSAGMFSGALLILAFTVPIATRPIYTGFLGSMYGIASVAGPLLGGVFTDRLTWRWCFYINLPIGAITIFVIAIWFEDPDRSGDAAHRGHEKDSWKQKLWTFDPVGSFLFMPAIICLLLALQWGGTEYAWNSGRIIALFVVFGVLIIGWLFVQHRQGDLATVPPRIMKNRTVWAGSWFSFCVGAAFLSAVYFIPIWFQAVKGVSAVQSGIMNLPMLLSVVVMSVVAGALVTLWGYYTPFMLLGTVLMSAGFGLLSTWVPDTQSPTWIGYQILAGAGVGFGMQQPLMAVQAVLDMADVPVGTSVVVFLQTLGGALFVSISQNVFTNKLVEYLAVILPGVDTKTVLSSGATNLENLVPPELIPAILRAYSDALTKTFLVSTALATFSVVGSGFMEWHSVKGKPMEMAA